MNAKQINKIQVMYKQTKNHEAVMDTFSLNPAQEYAINIFGRDKGLSAEYLAERIGRVTDGMNIGQVAEALDFPKEAALEVGPRT